MNAKKHGKVTMALAMIGGLAALSIAYAAISTQLNINSGENTKVESAAVMFDDTPDACAPYGYSLPDGSTSVSSIDTPDTLRLADCGKVDISTTTKKNDTVTINGTTLRDFGAYVIYQLTIVNKGNEPVKLTNDPNSNSVTEFTTDTDEDIRKNVTINVYSKDTCNEAEKVKGFSGGETPSESKANYILGNGSTTWYVKVAHRAYGGEYGGSDPTDNTTSSTVTTEDIKSGSFGFTIKPVWENV